MVRDVRDTRRGVTFLPPARLPQAPTHTGRVTQAAAKKNQPPNGWELGAMLASAGQQQQQPKSGGGGMMGGLGVLLNNPVTKNLLKPLEVLDYGRRATILGQETMAEMLPEVVERALIPLGIGVPLSLVDEERTRADDRSWTDKLTDSSYGWGQVGMTTGNKWVDRGIGLVGDIALDPLTYASFGAAPLLKGAPTIGRAARTARMAEGVDALTAAGRLTPEVLDAAKLAGGKIDDPAIDMLRKVGERGYQAGNAETRGLMGLQKSGMRLELPFTDISTGVIPGTGKIADAINNTTGVLRGAANRGKFGQRLASARTPQKLKGAAPYLFDSTKGTDIDFLTALTNVELDDMKRAGSGFFKAMGAAELKQRSELIQKELEETFGGDINKMLDATELDPNTSTELNKLAERMIEIGRERGVELPQMEGMGYVPHVLSREFRDLLAERGAKAEQFMAQAGVVMDDTMRDSGFLLERKLRPDPGTVLPLDVGGKQIVIENGSISEINAKVAELFPELKGTALETSPSVMYENYIAGVADDVGLREARAKLAAKGNPFVESRQDLQGESYRRLQGEDKPLQGDKMFRAEPDAGGTVLANEQVAKQAARTYAEQSEAADLLRLGGETAEGNQVPGLVDELTDLRTEIRAPLTAKSNAIGGRVRKLQDDIQDVMASKRSVASQKGAAKRLAEKTLKDLDAEATKLGRDIGATKRTLRRLTETERMDYIRGLNDQLHALRNEAEELLTWFDSGIADEMGLVRERLATLRTSLDAAERNMDEVMSLVRPKMPTGTPDEIVALAESIPAGPGGRPLSGIAEPPMRGVAPPPAEAGATARARNKALTERNAIQAEIKDLEAKIARPEKLMAQMEKIAQGTEDKAPNLVQLRKFKRQHAKAVEEARGLDRKLADANQRLENAEARLRAVPAPDDISARHIGPGRDELIDVARKKVDVEETSFERNPRVADLRSRYEDLRRTPGLARSQQLEKAIPETEESLMRALQGKGTVADLAEEAAAREAAAVRPLADRQAQLRKGAAEVPQDLSNELQRLAGQTDDLNATQALLEGNRDALVAQRAELKTALDASPTRPLDRSKAPQRHETRGVDARDSMLIGKEPLSQVMDEIYEMARLNPDATDESLNIIEGQLHVFRRKLEQIAQHDLKANQAQDVLSAASQKQFVKVYTAMLREGWKQMPEPNMFVRQELINMMQNAQNVARQPGLLGSTMTAFTNFFKTYATLSPGFHVRNALSATFMNVADGVDLRHIRNGVDKWSQFTKAADPLKFYNDLTPKWREAFDAVFATGAGGRFFESGVGEATAIGRTRLKEGIFRNRATLLSQRAGQRVEGAVRLGMAYDTVVKGATVRDAINRVTRVHFDYSQVSDFDEKAKRLIPFWTFMSRNLPLQFTEMWMKPRTYAQYNSIVRNLSVPADPFTPEYILEGGGFNTGAKTPESNIPFLGMAPGMEVMLAPDLSHNRFKDDIEKLENVLNGENPAQLLSDFNPILTAPLEYATGTNLFTGRRYEDDDVRKASGITDMAMLPLMMLANQVERGKDGDLYYKEKGVDTARSLIPILDRVSRLAPQTAGGEAGDRQAESMARFLGIPVRTISDDQKQNERRRRYFEARDQRDHQRALGF